MQADDPHVVKKP